MKEQSGCSQTGKGVGRGGRAKKAGKIKGGRAGVGNERKKRVVADFLMPMNLGKRTRTLNV